MRLCLYKEVACKYLIIQDKSLHMVTAKMGRSQWPCGLRRRSTAALLLRSWVRISPETRMSVSCDCCVLSGRGLCDGLITRPEECYRLINILDNKTFNFSIISEGRIRKENKGSKLKCFLISNTVPECSQCATRISNENFRKVSETLPTVLKCLKC